MGFRGTLALFAALALTTGTPVRATDSTPSPSPSLLDQFAKRWASINDYSATIVAHEVSGSKTDDRTMHFWFRKPDRAKLEMVGGSASGSVLIWTGGPKAHVRAPGLGFIPLWLDVHSPTITSLRGNTMLRPDLGPTVTCFNAHRDAVKEGTGPEIDGHATQTLTLEIAGGIDCAGDPSQDKDVTKDVLTMQRDGGLVVLRERYTGSTVVERWEIRDARINSGLTDADFK